MTFFGVRDRAARRPRAVPAVVVAVLLAVPLAASGPAAAATGPSPTCGTFVSHRGEHTRWTENTLRAMKAAAAVGADYVEVDVRETKDSALILMHDRTIDRTTRRSGTVSAMTLSALRKVVLNDGTRITSLSRNLDAIKDSPMKVMLEIKAITTKAGWSALAREINEFGVDQVVVTSFRPRLLDAVHAVEPDVDRSLLTAETPTIEQAEKYGSVNVHYPKIERSWLLAMRAAGYPVFAWTLNAKAAWTKWNGRVNAITTDDAAGFARWSRTAECPEIAFAE